MKIKIRLLFIGIIIMLFGNVSSQVQRLQLNGNDISAYFQSTGVFDQNTTSTNAPGFEWPKGSGKYAIFTTGLSIAAKINGQIAQSMVSYKGEFAPGYALNGVPFTNSSFKIYKINRGDNAGNNPDYANWHQMIPYGAPYIDVNNNHQYDAGIDSIGIRNASQVVFLCMTDGFPTSHSIEEGFGGGDTTQLLYSQISWTAWCYDRNDLKDIQFIKWSIINRSTNQWNSAYFSIVCDPDVGDANDDFIGCDTTLKICYCYNGDNQDGTGSGNSYGANPPASGIILLKSPKGFTSFVSFTDNGVSPPPCESTPYRQQYPAYLMMKGFKKDSSNFLNPLTIPPTPTKFIYSGDPETNSGWTENKGSVQNCGGNTGTIINVNPVGDRRFVMSSGAEDYTVYQGDTLTICASQFIARGNSNLNSVTLLKNKANISWSIFNSSFNVGIEKISSNIPSDFVLYQNYPNPFNPVTKIKFEIPSDVKREMSNVKLVVYDILGKEIKTLINEQFQPGSYEVTFDGSNLASGIYFYWLESRDFKKVKRMAFIK